MNTASHPYESFHELCKLHEKQMIQNNTDRKMGVPEYGNCACGNPMFYGWKVSSCKSIKYMKIQLGKKYSQLKRNLGITK